MFNKSIKHPEQCLSDIFLFQNICGIGKCKDDINSYKCECPNGWTGENCETNINDCHPDPCSEHGKCFDKIGGYECQCDPGFEGTQCEKNINECDPLPCKNSGTDQCLDLTNGYKCLCLPGFTGPKCEININDCKVNLNVKLVSQI